MKLDAVTVVLLKNSWLRAEKEPVAGKHQFLQRAWRKRYQLRFLVYFHFKLNRTETAQSSSALPRCLLWDNKIWVCSLFCLLRHKIIESKANIQLLKSYYSPQSGTGGLKSSHNAVEPCSLFRPTVIWSDLPFWLVSFNNKIWTILEPMCCFIAVLYL